MQKTLYDANENIVFRVDATHNIGTGHLMRCLILADILFKQDFTCLFVTKDMNSDLVHYIRTRGYDVFPINNEELSMNLDAESTIEVIKLLTKKPKWVIVDHYGIDSRWENILRPHTEKIMVIDDLADRIHDCDILLDQNNTENYKLRYNELVISDCKLFLGSQYLILRDLFYSERNNLHPRSGKVKRILVFFGGSDPTEETMKVLECLSNNNFDNVEFNFLVGLSNKNKHLIERETKGLENVNFYCQVENISELILKSDFALGAGGISMWERCYLGLPSAVTIVAENQQESVVVAEYNQTIWNMGRYEDISSEDYTVIIKKAISSPNALKTMSKNCLELSPNSNLQYVINEIITG